MKDRIISIERKKRLVTITWCVHITKFSGNWTLFYISSSQRNKFQIRNSSRISKLINTRTSFTKIVTR